MNHLVEAQENQRNCRIGSCLLLGRGYESFVITFVLHLRGSKEFIWLLCNLLSSFSELYTIVQRLAALRTAMSWECRNGVRWVLDKLVAWDLVQARKIVGGHLFHSG